MTVTMEEAKNCQIHLRDNTPEENVNETKTGVFARSKMICEKNLQQHEPQKIIC
jgi:hypothetical protein